MDRHQLEDAALSLPEGDRWALLERLLESLDPGELGASEDVVAAWDAELDRRLDDIHDHRVEVVDAEEVHRRARAALRR